VVAPQPSAGGGQLLHEAAARLTGRRLRVRGAGLAGEEKLGELRARSQCIAGSRAASAADATVETLRGRYQLCARGGAGFEADEVVESADRKRDVRVPA